jgi:uncharacterized membrane protein
MKLIIDPVWPWTHLWNLLAPGGPPVILAAALAGLIAFGLPVWLHRPPLGHGRRGVLIGVGLALAVVLGYVARATWGTTGVTVGLLAVSFALLLVPMALAGLSIATYLAVPGVPRRRMSWILALRLLALALTLLAILRPSLGFTDRSQPRSQLFLVLDYSRSMTIKDEDQKRSRWEEALRRLKECESLLQRLRDTGVDVQFFKFAGGASELDPAAPGTADGKRTDVGGMLRWLLERRDGRARSRGLLVISDGADNGTAVPALGEAARWRNLPCPVHAFACGRPTTSLRQNDVAITAITTSPMPFVPVKGKLTVKVTIDARGYENSRARVRLFLEAAGKDGKFADREMTAKDVVLALTTGNEVELGCDAPAKPGEVKVKVVVETPEPDEFPLNNTIETFVTVSKEGISVLLVDKPRPLEPKLIIMALENDPRIRITPVWLRGGKPADRAAASLFNFETQPYDVIIVGDVTAHQMRDIDPDSLKKIEKLVAAGSGFLMLGGYGSFGGGGWKGTEIEPILPVDLNFSRQEESPVQMVPTADGLRRTPYLFRVDDDPDLAAAWKRVPKLEGMTLLRLPRPRRGIETVLATADDADKTPLLVTQNYSRRDKAGKGSGAAAGRVLAFGGDSTWRWVRDEKSARLHERFWKQMVVWLAKQEDAEGSVWVRPEVRRLPARGELGFQVGLRGKGGGPDIPGGKYKVEVTAPDGTKTTVPVAVGARENRGTFAKTEAPGVYRITVQGEGKDPSGGSVSGTASARVIVYDEDLEMTRAAADHDFLRKVAAAGGGDFHRVGQLPAFLNSLLAQPQDQGRARLDLRPDWRGTGRSAFLMLFFLAFVVLVSGEWLLRRRWGLV